MREHGAGTPVRAHEYRFRVEGARLDHCLGLHEHGLVFKVDVENKPTFGEEVLADPDKGLTLLGRVSTC